MDVLGDCPNYYFQSSVKSMVTTNLAAKNNSAFTVEERLEKFYNEIRSKTISLTVLVI
jgi:hypothetical protein